MAKNTPETNETRQSLSDQAKSEQLYAISEYLRTVTFTPKLMGVDQADVWRKLEKLCQLYEDAFTAQRMYSAQLEESYSALKAEYANLQERHAAVNRKARQVLAAYQELAGKDGANG